MEGWVKLHRSLLRSPVFKCEKPLRVWIWCLLRANHQQTKILWNGSEARLKPGQFITGRFEGARECFMKPSTFWYQLCLLRRWGNLDIQSDNKSSLVTVVNWLQYQSASEKSDSQIDNGLTASEQRVDTDKKERMLTMKTPSGGEGFIFENEVLKITTNQLEEMKTSYPAIKKFHPQFTLCSDLMREKQRKGEVIGSPLAFLHSHLGREQGKLVGRNPKQNIQQKRGPGTCSGEILSLEEVLDKATHAEPAGGVTLDSFKKAFNLQEVT